MSITINGTTGIAGVDGSASTPAIQGNDTNTGMFFPAADTIAFAEGGTEVARFDSSGNLLVNTTTNANSSRVVVNGVIESTSGGIRFPNGTTQTAAATSLPGAQAQVFTGNGTFTIPANITAIKVTVVGGGGGSGGANPTVCAQASGGNGGGGGTAIRWLTGLTPGATLAVVVGAAGTAGAAGGSGGAGGTSSVSSGTQTITTISGNGGGAGGGGNPGSGAHGAGGAASGGDINTAGSNGFSFASGVSLLSTQANRLVSPGAGVAGTGRGGGGAGPNSSAGGSGIAGSAGSAGIVIFEW